MIIISVVAILVQIVNCQDHNTTTPAPHHVKPTSHTEAFHATPLDSLPVQQTSYHDPSGHVTCSISIADDADPFRLTDDDFGYPKYMVEDAFRGNELATKMFEMYLRKPTQDVKPDTIHLHRENTNTVSQSVSQLKPHGAINTFANAQANNHPFVNQQPSNQALFGNQIQPQNFQTNFVNSVPFPKNQNGGGFHGFDFSSPISNTKDKANIVTNGFHFPSGGIPIFRKKRMSGFQTTFTGFKTPKYLCESQSIKLRRYENYGGKCFIIEPEVQNINFVKCKKQKCSSCNEFNGVTQCAPESRMVWVWSYCEALPRDKKIVFDKIKIPTHCACKTFEC